MDMNLHLHRVLGLYRTRAAADAVVAGRDDVLENVLKDGAAGTVVGSIAGAIGSAAMAAASTSLLLAPLVMVGWGAGLDSGHIVLVAHTDGDAQTARAHQVIGESMGQSFPLPGSTS